MEVSRAPFFMRRVNSEVIMSKVVRSAKSKILTALKNGRNVTVNQVRARYGIQNVSARVAQLRNEGYSIYTNRTKRGFAYRWGTPSQTFISECAAKGITPKGPTL